MARRGNRFGYQEYRGRGGKSAVLKFIVALLVVVLIAGVVFMVAMSEYIEYTDTGVRFDPPWEHREEPEDVPASPQVIIIEETPSPSPSQTEPEPEPEPAEAEELRAVRVTTAQLLDGTAAEVVKASGGNALLVDMKTGMGRLAWQSQTALAGTLRVNGDAAVAQAVADLAEEDELYLVARIQCFRDVALASNGYGTLMTRGGNQWYDPSGYRWVSPLNETAAAYLEELCRELAEMGFDELVLDSAGYPDAGEVYVLATDANRPADLTAPVEAFFQRISDAVEEKAALSFQVSGELLAGTNANSGMTAELLARFARRVWTAGPVPEGADYTAALTEAGMADAADRLVVGDAETGSWYLEKPRETTPPAQ